MPMFIWYYWIVEASQRQHLGLEVTSHSLVGAFECVADERHTGAIWIDFMWCHVEEMRLYQSLQ